MVVGIDVSRSKSGGAKAHIIGVIDEIDKSHLEEIKEIHIWGYDEILKELPDRVWLIKHQPRELEKSILSQLWWQYYSLPKEAKNLGVDIMFNTDAGSVCPFKPSVTLSQDMLSYEPGEIDRFGWGLRRLRLELLKYIQIRSLKNATSAFFLTDYAARVIQTYTGQISSYAVIPHGVNQSFDISSEVVLRESLLDKQPINCVYVSNVDLYKHQWNVASSIHELRVKGYDVTCTFIGGGSGKAQQMLDQTLESIPRSNDFIKQLSFIPHEELPLLLKKFDIFIFASSCENMPITLIEGMKTGLPIISSDRGPMPEVLKDAGVYFNPEDVGSLTKNLERLITNNHIRLENSKKSLKLSSQYSWKRCSFETFNNIIDTYKSYMDEK